MWNKIGQWTAFQLVDTEPTAELTGEMIGIANFAISSHDQHRFRTRI
jgi:hypothetical protein